MKKADVSFASAFMMSALGGAVIAAIIWFMGEHPCAANEYTGRGPDGMCTGLTSDLWGYVAIAAPSCAAFGLVIGAVLHLVAEFFMEDDKE